MSRLHPTHGPSNAVRKIRLADFETGKGELTRPEHIRWLDETLGFIAAQNTYYWIHIYGHASKLNPRGVTDPEASRALNLALSYARANSVARYLVYRNPHVDYHIEQFSARGSDDYKADSKDNSEDERAVEVHIFVQPTPPPAPPGVVPLPALPGGRRYRSWAVGVPCGVTVNPCPWIPAVISGNLVIFQCHELNNATHAYLSPASGVGYSFTGPQLSTIKETIKAILGSISYTGMSLTPFAATTPFNFADLDGSVCMLAQFGLGAGVGCVGARAWGSGQVFYRDANGRQQHGVRGFYKDVNVSGKGLVTGASASGVGGPLVRLW